MTSVMLILVLLFPSQIQLDAHRTWDRLSWEYKLPPATITIDPQWMRPSALAAFAGLDTQGRATIGVRPAPRMALANNVAHEAAHALLRDSGMTEYQQHEWADSFALCVNGITPHGTEMKTCDDVDRFFATFRR